MPRVAKLSADLTANTSNFESNMKRANSQMRGTRRLFQNELGAISNSFKTVATAAVGFLAVGKISSDFKKMVNYLDDMADGAQRVGISSEAYSKLAFAAKQSEVSLSALEKSTARLQKLLITPTDQFTKALALLKLNAEDLRNVGADEAIAKIADGLNALQDPTLKAATSQAILGDKVRSISDLLNKGGAAIRAYGDDAQRLGIVVEKESGEKAEKFKEAMNEIQAAYQGMIIQLADEGALDGGIKALEAFTAALSTVLQGVNDLSLTYKEFTGNLDKNNLNDLNRLISIQEDAVNQANQRDNSKAFGIARMIDPVAARQSTGSDEAKKLQELITLRTQLNEKITREAKDKQILADADRAAASAATSKLVAEQKHSELSDKNATRTASIIAGLRQESSELDIQVGMYGQKEGAINRARRELELNNEITQAGITLTKEQRTQIDNYLDQIETQGNLYDELEEQSKRLSDQERDRQQALSQLGASFESAFEDAIVNGEELSDVIQGLTQDILKLMLRTTITAPLGNAITGLFSGGGGGDLFSGMLSSFSSHATGLDYVPRDMEARIHKGERILTADENRDFSKSEPVTVNVINNTNGQVSATQSKEGNGQRLDIMIDQAVAENIVKAGSRTNQALKSFNSRTLIKR